MKELKREKIRLESYTLYIEDLSGPLDGLEDRIRRGVDIDYEIVKDCDVFLELRYEHYYEDYFLYLDVCRMQTDEEFEKDKIKQKKASERAREAARVRKEKKLEQERKTFERLKKKFGE
jgi:hypothetical protein